MDLENSTSSSDWWNVSGETMSEQLIVAGITFLISLFGAAANLLVFFSARKMSSMNSSFGVITKNQAICNTIMCLIFLLYVCPMQLSDAKTLVKYSHFLGVTAMTVYEVSNSSHLLIALNRFCAVFLPMHYEQLFSKFGTKVLAHVLWVFAIALCISLYEIVGCYFSYDDVSWTMGFLATEMCTKLTWYSDFTFNTSLVVMTLVINLLTAYKAGKNSRMLMNAAGIKMSKRQRQREINFIKQTFFQGTTIFAGQVTYYVIAPFVSNAILLFFVASLWAFMHAVEGGIILLSNEEMRAYAFKKRKQSGTSVFVTSVSLS